MNYGGSQQLGRPWPSWARWLAWSIGAVGIGAAVWHYLQARTFFIDEVKLLWNVADRDWSNLLEPLANNQAAAVGFLILEKTLLSLLGVSELSSRLLPLIAMALSVVVFIPTSRRLLSPVSGVVATMLFAWSMPLIYYASQSKQYTLDVLACCTVLLATLWVLEDLDNRRRWIVLLVVGVGAILLSLPAIIVLVGSTITLLVAGRRGGGRRPAIAAMAVGALFVGVFGALYLWKYRLEGSSDYLAGYWTIGFLPPIWQPIRFASALLGFTDRLMREVVGIHFRAAGLVAYLIGLAVLLRRKRTAGILMASTMAVAVGLASLHLYPLKERAALYLLPFLVIPIAAVWDEASASRDRFARLAAGVLLGVVLIGPVTGLGGIQKRADIKPVMDELLRLAEPGDTVYIYWRPQRVIDFYDSWELGPGLLQRTDLAIVRGRAHIDEPLAYVDAVEALAHEPGVSRVWFLYSRRYAEKGIDEVEIYRRAFDQSARLISEIEAADAGAWLYDFSVEP